MKKQILFVLLCLAFGKIATAQLSLGLQLNFQPDPDPREWPNQDGLLVVTTVNNTNETVEYKYRGKLLLNGEVILDNTLSKMPTERIEPFETRISEVQDVLPPVALNVYGDIKKTYLKTNQIPAGNYLVCAQLVSPSGKELSAEACAPMLITSYQQPSLVFPVQHTTVPAAAPPVFSWTPVTPPPPFPVEYRLRVMEVPADLTMQDDGTQQGDLVPTYRLQPGSSSDAAVYMLLDKNGKPYDLPLRSYQPTSSTSNARLAPGLPEVDNTPQGNKGENGGRSNSSGCCEKLVQITPPPTANGANSRMAPQQLTDIFGQGQHPADLMQVSVKNSQGQPVNEGWTITETADALHINLGSLPPDGYTVTFTAGSETRQFQSGGLPGKTPSGGTDLFQEVAGNKGRNGSRSNGTSCCEKLWPGETNPTAQGSTERRASPQATGTAILQAFNYGYPLIDLSLTNQTQSIWPPDVEVPLPGHTYVWSVQALREDGQPIGDNSGTARPEVFVVPEEVGGVNARLAKGDDEVVELPIRVVNYKGCDYAIYDDGSASLLGCYALTENGGGTPAQIRITQQGGLAASKDDTPKSWLPTKGERRQVPLSAIEPVNGAADPNSVILNLKGAGSPQTYYLCGGGIRQGVFVKNSCGDCPTGTYDCVEIKEIAHLSKPGEHGTPTGITNKMVQDARRLYANSSDNSLKTVCVHADGTVSLATNCEACQQSVACLNGLDLKNSTGLPICSYMVDNNSKQLTIYEDGQWGCTDKPNDQAKTLSQGGSSPSSNPPGKTATLPATTAIEPAAGNGKKIVWVPVPQPAQVSSCFDRNGFRGEAENCGACPVGTDECWTKVGIVKGVESKENPGPLQALPLDKVKLAAIVKAAAGKNETTVGVCQSPSGEMTRMNDPSGCPLGSYFLEFEVGKAGK